MHIPIVEWGKTMRFLISPFLAVLSAGCAANSQNATFGGQDITAYISGPWRSYMSDYSSTPQGTSCVMSAGSTNSLPVRAFFRSSVPRATVTTDTRTGERDRIAFYVAYEQDLKSQPVVVVNAKEFKLVANGEFAYPSDSGAEQALLKAMKSSSAVRSSKAVLRGVAKDGTSTEDNFGLEGFEAQLNSMNGHCLGRRQKSS